MPKIPLALRIEPEIKKAALELAEKQNRSLTNLIEWLIMQEYEREGAAIKKKRELA